jgi:hypothetical protein
MHLDGVALAGFKERGRRTEAGPDLCYQPIGVLSRRDVGGEVAPVEPQEAEHEPVVWIERGTAFEQFGSRTRWRDSKPITSAC